MGRLILGAFMLGFCVLFLLWCLILGSVRYAIAAVLRLMRINNIPA